MTIREDLALTAELTGADLSEAAAKLLVAELEQYEAKAVHGALTRCRRELQGRLTLAAIIDRLDDGRPGPEEAWAMFPRSEADSAVITSDMRAAMGPALRLLADGDEIAARMAFLEAYRRQVAQARAERKPVSWRVTLGHDPAGRVGVLIDAARAGRIPAKQAIDCAGGRAEEIERALGQEPRPALGSDRTRKLLTETVSKLAKKED